MQAFCFTCLQLLCIDCLLDEHKKHRVLPLKEASSRLIDKLQHVYQLQFPIEQSPSPNDQTNLKKVQSESAYFKDIISRLLSSEILLQGYYIKVVI